MRKQRRKVDLVSIELQNNRHKDHIKSIRKNLEKFDSGFRDRNKCGYCSTFARSRIGGSAITTVQCALCDKELTFGNTATDILCDDCAAENNLCKQCGADQELKNRRKSRHFEVS